MGGVSTLGALGVQSNSSMPNLQDFLTSLQRAGLLQCRQHLLVQDLGWQHRCVALQGGALDRAIGHGGSTHSRSKDLAV